MSQLDLITGEPVPAVDRAAPTERQQFALDTIRRLQPLATDELGAYLHQYRLEHGGRGHGSDERCPYCQGEGREMGEALKRKGLVVYKRTLGWTLPDWTKPSPLDDSEIPF